VGGAIDSFMTGHADFYAGIIFVIFVLYAPIGMVGTLRLRLDTPSVAKYVAKRLFETPVDDLFDGLAVPTCLTFAPGVSYS
jgi:hypothetical protein